MLAPEAVLVMKVGFHEGEELPEIVARKLAEIGSGGTALWGSGGSACHPVRQVQPFAESATTPVEVVMLPTPSRPRVEGGYKTEMSVDGAIWTRVPRHVHTSGERALVLDGLEMVDETIDLGYYKIAVGPSAGKSASHYLQGQSDKACLRRTVAAADSMPKQVVTLARLAAPWAVFLR